MGGKNPFGMQSQGHGTDEFHRIVPPSGRQLYGGGENYNSPKGEGFAGRWTLLVVFGAIVVLGCCCWLALILVNRCKTTWGNDMPFWTHARRPPAGSAQPPESTQIDGDCENQNIGVKTSGR